MKCKELLQSDFKRYGSGGVSQYLKTWHWFFRKAQASHGIVGKIFCKAYLMYSARHGIEINPFIKIGPGLYIGHPYGITINPGTVVGRNCNIHKGVTIGQENRGKRAGVPVIGNEVWMGVNSTIVGKIKIGDNVLIAPNTFVNCDVPSNSVVFGNPCIIKEFYAATEKYINNKVE